MRPLSRFAIIPFCLASIAIASSVAAAEPPKTNSIARIGDLALDFDATMWTVDGNGDRTTISCIADDCHRTHITATIVDAADTPCTSYTLAGILMRSPADFGPGDPPDPATFSANGLSFHLASAYLGCRNWAGGPVSACTQHAGSTYLFDAPGDGCHTSPHFDEMVMGVLLGLRPE